MTDEELKAIEADIAKGYLTEDWRLKHLVPLVAEVRRLRGLVKAAEWFPGVGVWDSEYGCPWCESDGFYESSFLGHGSHNPDCPAFTPDGQVR